MASQTMWPHVHSWTLHLSQVLETVRCDCAHEPGPWDSQALFGEGQGRRRSLHKSVRLAALLSFTVVLLRTSSLPIPFPGLLPPLWVSWNRCHFHRVSLSSSQGLRGQRSHLCPVPNLQRKYFSFLFNLSLQKLLCPTKDQVGDL